MIEEQALVISTDGEFAIVETERKATCGGCAGSSTCGVSAISKVFGQRRSSFKVLNGIGASPGEQVILGLAESTLLKSSVILYLVPLFSFFLFSLLGRWLATLLEFKSTEPMIIVSGLLGLLVGLLYLRYHAGSTRSDKRYQAVILRRAGRVYVTLDG
ncbi:MAG: SoxR reducing system RseC family protein [Candidatus Sedimenticola sp. (ex Thyasira tokunagai)]